MGSFLYATDSMFLDYKFKVVEEDDNYYYVKDVSTTWNELSQNIFKVQKEPLKFISSADKKFNFIFENKEFFVAHDKESVKTYVKEMTRRRLCDEIPLVENTIKELEQKISSFNFSSNWRDENRLLWNVSIGDTVFIEKERELYKGFVVGYVTYDRQSYIPLIKSKEIGCHEGRIKEDWRGEHYVTFDIENDFYDECECRIFKSLELYEGYKSEKELNRIKDLLTTKRKRLQQIYSWLNNN